MLISDFINDLEQFKRMYGNIDIEIDVVKNDKVIKDYSYDRLEYFSDLDETCAIIVKD